MIMRSYEAVSATPENEDGLEMVMCSLKQVMGTLHLVFFRMSHTLFLFSNSAETWHLYVMKSIYWLRLQG